MSGRGNWQRERALAEVDAARRVALSMLRYYRESLKHERERIASWARDGLGQPDGWPRGFCEGCFRTQLAALLNLRKTRRWIERVLG